MGWVQDTEYGGDIGNRVWLADNIEGTEICFNAQAHNITRR